MLNYKIMKAKKEVGKVSETFTGEQLEYSVYLYDNVKVSEHYNHFTSFDVMEKYLNWAIGKKWNLEMITPSIQDITIEYM